MLTSLVAGAALSRPCGNAMHGRRNGWFASYEQDPDCLTCLARAALAQHDHLHLDGKPCPDGEMVKCKCGSYHH